MRKLQWKKCISLFVLVFAICITSILNVNASSKIKSKSVTVNASKVTMGVGDIVTLDAIMTPTNSTDKLTWSSSKKKVATVNQYGVVTAVREGTSTITVKTSSKKTAKCVITVKKVLTEAEVSDLISQNCLSEESVKKLISENTISESQVIDLIKQNSLTEDSVKKLIQNSTLTEDDVKRIVAESSGVNYGGATEWEDGTELVCSQSFPLSFTGTYLTGGNTIQYTAAIEKVSVKKYHYSGEWRGVPQRYKYVIEVEGVLP